MISIERYCYCYPTRGTETNKEVSCFEKRTECKGKNELIDIILKYCAFGQQRYQLNEREMQKTTREQRIGDILLTCYLF